MHIAWMQLNFSRPWRLEAHISAHCGETPFKCDVEGCTKGYTSKSHLARHKKTVHSGGYSPSRLYKCPHEGCDAVLKTNQNLNKHVKRAHVLKRECPECGEKFSKTIQLKYHMQFHSGEFIYNCEECNRKFARRTEYNRHMRSHRIHLCPYRGCVIGFAQWSAVRRHLKTHRPRYVCHDCNKPFMYKTLLREHVVSHLPGNSKQESVLKPYKCFHCNKTIFGKLSLRRHIKTIHFKIKVSRPKKSKKPRKPRKDKGTSKPAFAFSSELSGVEVAGSLKNTLLESYEPVLETAEDIIAAIEEALLGTEADLEPL
uniref:C2H2-type domain-containing protein n=1 Tax=Lygus hesperus TaxID=30085 RepID=A0A0K8SDQ0_LYGHE